MPADHSPLETFGPLVLVGIARCHRVLSDDEALSSGMAKQWRELLRAVFRVMALLPPLGYGAGLHFEPTGESLEFFCGFVLRPKARLPKGLRVVAIPECSCAVFHHAGSLSRLRYTLDAIFTTALPLIGLQPLDPTGEVPSFLLRATPCFNPLTGFGGVDVLVPVAPPE